MSSCTRMEKKACIVWSKCARFKWKASYYWWWRWQAKRDVGDKGLKDSPFFYILTFFVKAPFKSFLDTSSLYFWPQFGGFMGIYIIFITFSHWTCLNLPNDLKLSLHTIPYSLSVLDPTTPSHHLSFNRYQRVCECVSSRRNSISSGDYTLNNMWFRLFWWICFELQCTNITTTSSSSQRMLGIMFLKDCDETLLEIKSEGMITTMDKTK